MSGYAGNVVCLVIVLMTSQHTNSQPIDVSALKRMKLTIDRDISELRFQVTDLRMIVDKMVNQRNASDGSIVAGPFLDYGQVMPGIDQKELTDIKTKLKAHENHMNILFGNVNDLKKENAALKLTVDKLVNEKENDEDKDEFINKLKAELLQLNKDVETKCGDKVNALEDKFQEFAMVIQKGYKDLKTHVNGIAKLDAKPEDNNEMKIFVFHQMNNLSQSMHSEHNKLSARIDQADAKIVRLDGAVNKLEASVKVIDELKTKTDKCCIGQQPGFRPGVSPTPVPLLGTTVLPNGYRIKTIFGSELPKYIDIGTRVVRGADWAWGDQDGGGPGTVDSWYGGSRTNQQVMVTWDMGNTRRANYRVGAYGKYDLYILDEGQ